MAEAVVGDDVFQDDPTVRELEAEVAGLFGREAALFVPSGCQGNQIAAHLHGRPGEEVVVGDTSHTFDWELAGLAVLSGLQARPLPAELGVFDLDQVASTLQGAIGFRPAIGLLMVENTHNFHGGAVVPLSHLQALYALAQENGVRVHLDGARIWNAATASGVSLQEYGAVADSIMACLSKGLGAPVGSVLVGEQAFIAKARQTRKLFGGGMRQTGVLAAPGLVALRTQRALLTEDHKRAARLAAGFQESKDIELPYGAPQTNIVFVRARGRSGASIAASLADAGVLAIATGPETLRFVTHYDVDDEAVSRAIEAFQRAVA
jgi:threonine aldolase